MAIEAQISKRKDGVHLRCVPGHRTILIEGGAHGLFLMGGTGEFFCFPDREKGRAIEIVVEEAGSRVPVIAGVTDLSTCRAI